MVIISPHIFGIQARMVKMDTLIFHGIRYQSILWSYIDDTNFHTNFLIIIGGQDFAGHYTVVLDVDTKKHHYLIMDQSLKVWLIDMELFEMLSIYKLTKSAGLYTVHSIYRIGKN